MSNTTLAPGVLRLRGVRQHNLKNIDLDLPLGRLIVITGPSGSGKSSLAFDTLFAEGQRRYVETFSPYARQFFDRMDKPAADHIEGIPPAIAIEQRNAVRSTRSTVGTMTELCDYLKQLWPYLARLHCRGCGKPVHKDSPGSIWEQALLPAPGRDLMITFDLPLSEKIPLAEELELVGRQGYQRLWHEGRVLRLEDAPGVFAPAAPTRLTVVQDRVRAVAESRSRFVEACEAAFQFGRGRLEIREWDGAAAGAPAGYSNRLHCAACDLEYREPTPALFSFNHPIGACPECKGFGRIISIDYGLALPDPSKTLAQGAVRPWQTGFSAECQEDMTQFARRRKVPMNTPFRELSEAHQAWVLHGDPGYGSTPELQWPHAWYGVQGYFKWLESKSYKMHVRVLLSRYRAYTQCPACRGRRFQPESLLYRVPASKDGPELTLADFYSLPVRQARQRVAALAGQRQFAPNDPLGLVLEEVQSRLGYLDEIGVGYLTLDRPTRTLSGGETERVNLTTCLGTRLVNTLFVLDEPSVGLHPRDTERLVGILARLRDTGNTVVVVEHEPAVMRAADEIVDLGPGHGETGGQVVFQGTYPEILKARGTLTGDYLSGRWRIEIPGRRPVRDQAGLSWLRLAGATRHNLQNLTVEIPLGRLVCLTGVSGSGKTTLLREELLPALQRHLAAPAGTDAPEEEAEPGACVVAAARLEGWQGLDRVVLVDQSSLGKTPRSNPAVYTGAFEDIRDFFARSEEARQRGLSSSAFSFNSADGQCPRCRGAGFEKVEMQFLSDVFIRCPDCDGRRYRPHILEVRIAPAPGDARSWSIGDMLEATVDEAVGFLEAAGESKPAQRALGALRALQETGLGYLRLGQPVNTLSGGESQRLKLSAHLAAAEAAGTRPSLFLFDEPTTGLHYDDVRVLLQVFHRLADAGHSVVVVEHNLEVIKSADWIIDLGPEAGSDGGRIVAAGTPEEVAACKASHTGRYLQETLAAPGPADAPAFETRRKTPAKRALLPVKIDPGVEIRGAREHNLRNLDVTVPRNQFVVVTGVSGSGKSTLAFDLLFAEGQRRFLDSMSAYARQFVEQMPRPEVDLITGLPPTVSIEQRTTRGGGKSTVATVTEIYHFLRLLFARLGVQYCPDCQTPVAPQTRDEVARSLKREREQRGELILLAPVVRGRKGFHTDVAEWAASHGYAEVRADGRMVPASDRLRLDRFREHNVEIVTGVMEAGGRARGKSAGSGAEGARLQFLVDETLELGKGVLLALDGKGRATVHSTDRSCAGCGRSFEGLDPKLFSYNSAAGWCPRCRGFGETFWMPEDVDRGGRADAIEETWWRWSEDSREVCPECQGARLNPVARAVRLDLPGLAWPGGKAPAIGEFSALAVGQASEIFSRLKLSGRAGEVARDILPEIRERLRFLGEVGLDYLQMGRGVATLSGGEAQRIRLAAQLGSNLSGVMYILDEPTIGLHPRDNEHLLASLERLRARGNSLVVVEHDEATMRRADHIIDLGPGAGVNGGRVVAAGTLKELMRHPESVTGQCLRQVRVFPARGERRPVSLPKRGAKRVAEPASWLGLGGASAHNLKNIDVQIPLNRFVVVTGVSGSGKSTLLRECLLPALAAKLKDPAAETGVAGLARLDGTEVLQAVHEVDQSPIGRTPRSVPATYVGFFDEIRRLYARTPEARMRGYAAGRFSFNSPQGRCPECQGAGQIKLEMNFLPPAFVRCETCRGTRFNRETLDIRMHGRDISQTLDLSVDEALAVFEAVPAVRRPLEALRDTGLGYLKLGQTSPTLSGGEAQRVKLVTHLLGGLKAPRDIRRAARHNLFLLEEPTIGLHAADVRRLVEVIQRLVDAGHSVLVIEHQLDLIAEADWVIDLGPEAGEGGGRVVVAGTPEVVAQHATSHTGRFLRETLAGQPVVKGRAGRRG